MRRAVSFVRLRDEHDTIIKADLRNAVDSRFRPIFALRALGVRDVTASFFDRVVAHHINELTPQGAPHALRVGIAQSALHDHRVRE